jgi:hypothetical protein
VITNCPGFTLPYRSYPLPNISGNPFLTTLPHLKPYGANIRWGGSHSPPSYLTSLPKTASVPSRRYCLSWNLTVTTYAEAIATVPPSTSHAFPNISVSAYPAGLPQLKTNGANIAIVAFGVARADLITAFHTNHYCYTGEWALAWRSMILGLQPTCISKYQCHHPDKQLFWVHPFSTALPQLKSNGFNIRWGRLPGALKPGLPQTKTQITTFL